MSELNDLNKKYGQKTSKIKDIKDLTKALEENKAVKATKQAVAGFKSQWSGLDDEGRVGMGKGTPGIYYNTLALPAIAGVVDEKYAPAFAVEADKKAGKIKEAVRKDMGIDEPKGVLEHFAYAGGEMLGQVPVPGALMNKIVGGAKKMGMAGKVLSPGIEYFTPTIDPKAINYGIGTAFGGTIGAGVEMLEEEPMKKALGGLIQKYENGGKVGKVATFFSAVDKAINTLKQKKGTGEQVLKQLQTTPGVKPEELESRAIKRKLEVSPKITQEELQKLIAANKPPIPRRLVLGAGIDRDWQPRLDKQRQAALEELNIQPTVNPETGKTLGFVHPETGEILSKKEVLALTPEELGAPVDPATGRLTDEGVSMVNAMKYAVKEAQDQFDLALGETRTKFEQYSKSGGKDNYREVLLQHTGEGGLDNPAMVQRIDELLKSNPATEEEAAAINKEIDSLLDRISAHRRQFNASHWDDADVLAHYRVSDMKGPNGEKVLYVDEIQSDWHQQARDARKEEIKRLLDQEESSITTKAGEELIATKGNADITLENEQAFKAIKNRLRRERKAELEKQVDENFGYSKAEDDDKLYKLNSEVERLRNTGMTPEEIEKYYVPGKIIPSGRGFVKVLSFNSAENSPRYKQVYDEYYQRNMNIGVGEEVAAAADRNARKNALEKSKGQWNVTTVEVDAQGNPQGSPTTHSTSPEHYVVEDLRKEARVLESKKPDAPFKKNWHELAVKDILDLAANEGYDKVAFAPGIEQVKRYERDLRKAIDKIDYVPAADGSLMINGIKEGRTVFAGRLVDGAFVGGNAEGKTLSEVFGSSIAKQIEEEASVLHENVKSGRSDLVFQRGVIEGENLTIGGEGMKSFYDQRLPSFVKNYAGKEFKAPTGYMEFEGASPKAHSDEDLRRMIEQIGDEDSDELMERGTDLANEMTERALSNQGLTPGTVEWEDAFDNILDEMNMRAYNQASIELARERLDAARPSKKLKAFSVDVTPEMKEKITTQGQKLFAATPAIGLGAAQVPQQPAPAPAPAPEEQPQTSPEVPQAFQKGGKVGITTEAIKRIMGAFTDDIPEVLSPKKTQKNLEKYVEKSKVKKRVFHGSNNPEGIVDDKGFYHYDPGSSEIHWTTDDPDFADRYTAKYMEYPGEQGAIFPVHIQLQNPLEVPFDMNTRITPEVWKYAQDLGFSKSDFKEWLLENDKEKPKRAWQVVDSPQFREAAAYRGFDGIFAKEDGVNTWGVFEPTQIKSTFNQGTYDVKDPDIGKRDGGPISFQKGGKVGSMKDAAEAVLRVLHGSPTKVRLDAEKNLDVTTDTSYAMKRARDKMDARGIEGPPMVNKFDVPAAKMLRFEETYSPEDVAKMKRFYGKLPEGKAMTGEEIYEATGGKDYVLEGVARAGGFSGYQRPAGGSGGIGDWYRVTDQEALTRKARGGLMHLQKRYRVF